jgi:hypothetical protein
MGDSLGSHRSDAATAPSGVPGLGLGRPSARLELWGRWCCYGRGNFVAPSARIRTMEPEADAHARPDQTAECLEGGVCHSA